jgi:hypothetical protein
MLAATIIGHDAMFTLFSVLALCFTVFEGWGRGWKGFLLVNSHAELVLIGCTAWFDNKRRHLPTWFC